ncbi:MAG: TlpA disulfide reductase family protein [Candidatus Elarobacter sp.]
MIATLLAAAVAVLPFAAGDTGMPYSIAPTAAERTGLADRLAGDMRAHGVRVVRGAAACDDAVCARHAGMALGARSVVFGTATRYMAMIWGASTDIVDVRSGRVEGPYAVGYKGDYEALRFGIDDLAAALNRRLASPAHRTAVGRLAAPARREPPETRAASKSAAVGKPAPRFLVDGLDGGELSLETFRGRPLVINVFASWCGSCREELPRFVRAHAKHEAQVAFLAIDEQESPSIARAFARRMGLAFRVGLDDGPLMAAYGARTIPETIVIDARGIVRAIVHGPVAETVLERALVRVETPRGSG